MHALILKTLNAMVEVGFLVCNLLHLVLQDAHGLPGSTHAFSNLSLKGSQLAYLKTN